MFRHTIAFRLRHARGSLQEKAFLRDAKVLAEIPGIGRFEQLRQTSPADDFHFMFALTFESQDAFELFRVHPKYRQFYDERWTREVSASLAFSGALIVALPPTARPKARVARQTTAV